MKYPLDGLLITGFVDKKMTDESIRLLSNLPMPVVLLERTGGCHNISSVTFDNKSSIQEAVKYLFDMGHREIAYIGCSIRVEIEIQRNEGFWEALRQYNIPADKRRIILQENYSVEHGRAAMKKILKSGCPFTAVLAASDELAIGAMQIIQEACPSMMCADFGNLSKDIRELEYAGADIFHLDLMDGAFVPNYGMGLQDIQYIASQASIPCDIHMMSKNPGEYVEKFAKMGCSIIYIHPETDPNAARTLQKIIDSGAKAGIAINPGTSIYAIEPLLSIVKYVLVMTVNPGFAGQKYLSFVDEKVDRLLEHQKHYRYHIMIDGACSPEVISRLSAKGVEGFILGTSALFDQGRSFGEIMPELRAL